MNKLLIPALYIMALASCSQGGKPVNTGIDMSNLDTSVRPQDNFYQYACGGWIKNHPLTPEFARYGTFDQLRDNNQAQLKDLIEKLSQSASPAGSVQQKIGDLYAMGMDMQARNQAGNSPIQPQLTSIASIIDRAHLHQKIATLHTQQVTPFFVFFGEADFGNSSMNIPWLYQGGIGLGEREYYLEQDERSQEIRSKYVEHMARMFALAGYDQLSGNTAEQLAQRVMHIETQLATAAMDKVTQRNPQNIYHKMTVKELERLAPLFPWTNFLTTAQVPQTTELNVAQPEYIQAVSNLLGSSDMEDLKAYLAWQYIDFAAPYLSDNFVAQNFEFHGKVMSGKEEQRPLWKQTVDVVNSVLGEAVGQAYVAEYFPPEAKTRMLTLVANLQVALAERIDTLAWMSAQTKQKAHEKLNTFVVKIGYPDKWRDYSGLDIRNDSYFANIIRSNEFDFAYLASQMNKPLDKAKWQMTPQTVNAYYNPPTNEICFPAAILQPPFFNMNADDAVNYGAIGMVIAHEMTHGFDDQGSQYDKNGNLRNWWTAEDKAKFDARTKVLVDYFDNIAVLPGLHANGEYTLGENIADNGGVQVAYQGLQNSLKGQTAPLKDGFTPEQRFFIAYATVWAGNIRDQEIERLTKIDVHSLGRWRTNGTLPHIEAFARAFNVQPGDSMYLAPAQRAQIW